MLTPVEDVDIFTTNNTQYSPWTLLFRTTFYSFFSKQFSLRPTSC